MTSHDRYIWELLKRLESTASVSQRSLSRDLGIALGLTNWLLRRMQTVGWVEIVRTPPNRMHYSITPAGVARKAEMARVHIEEMLESYAATRETIRDAFARLSAAWSTTPEGGRTSGEKRIVFYGTGELAEIGYLTVQYTDLRLVAVIDEAQPGWFFGLPVYSPENLHPTHVGGRRFDRLVVMSIGGRHEIQARLDALDFPLQRVFWPCHRDEAAADTRLLPAARPASRQPGKEN